MKVLLCISLLFLLIDAGPLPKKKNGMIIDDGGKDEDGVQILIEEKGKPSEDDLPENQEAEDDEEETTPPPLPSDEKAQSILQRFGYVKPGALSGSSEEDEEDVIVQATKKFQRVNGLPETGVLDIATKKELNRPACGISVDSENYRQGEDKWPKTHLTYSITRWSGKIEGYSIRDTLRRAFAIWAAVTPLTFQEVSGQADITVGFYRRNHGDGSSFDGEGNVVAHGFFPTDGKLHFDEEEKWTSRNAEAMDYHGATDMLTTAVHEIGHVLGLHHHEEHRNSIMYPILHFNTEGGSYHDPVLSRDDIEDIQRLYGRKTGGNGGSRGNRINWRHGVYSSYYAFGCDPNGRDITAFYVDDARACLDRCYQSFDCFSWLYMPDRLCLLKGRFKPAEITPRSNNKNWICGAWF